MGGRAPVCSSSLTWYLQVLRAHCGEEEHCAWGGEGGEGTYKC